MPVRAEERRHRVADVERQRGVLCRASGRTRRAPTARRTTLYVVRAGSGPSSRSPLPLCDDLHRRDLGRDRDLRVVERVVVERVVELDLRTACPGGTRRPSRTPRRSISQRRVRAEREALAPSPSCSGPPPTACPRAISTSIAGVAAGTACVARNASQRPSAARLRAPPRRSTLQRLVLGDRRVVEQLDRHRLAVRGDLDLPRAPRLGSIF